MKISLLKKIDSKKQTNKNWIPTNNHHSIETFIEETFEPNNQRVERNARTAI